MLYFTRLLSVGIISVFLFSPQALAVLSDVIMEKMQAAVDSKSKTTVSKAVEELAKENPALAWEIASETAKIAPKSFACSIAAASAKGADADATETGNIVGATAAAIGSSSEELSEMIPCVSVSLKLNSKETARMTEVAQVVAIGLPPEAAQATAAGVRGTEARRFAQAIRGAHEKPPFAGENPHQDGASPQ